MIEYFGSQTAHGSGFQRKRRQQLGGGKQRRLRFPIIKHTGGKQKVIDEAVLNYCVNSMLPFRTVDDPSFRLLVTTLDPSAEVPTRLTLIGRIQERVQETRESIKSLLLNTPYAALCVDIRATKHDSFLGIVVTYIDDDFNRHLRLLSCQPFDNPHTDTGDRIAAALYNAHLEFGLPLSKLVATTTENATNNNTAFKDFGIRLIDDDETDDDVYNESDDQGTGNIKNEDIDIGELQFQSALLSTPSLTHFW